MKPKASLKSLKVNFRVMALRSFTSPQPGSLASALLRALPVSFSAMVATSRVSIVPRIALCRPLAKAIPALTYLRARQLILRPDDQRQPIAPPLLLPGGPDVLVAQCRHHRRNGGPRPRDLPVVSGLDFRRELGGRRRDDGVARTRVHGA